uniref:Uncharacterized protein n=1 Tax=Ascaris lumbricoides TaxID=6252 RepID=A0A9J2PS28_ASCLU
MIEVYPRLPTLCKFVQVNIPPNHRYPKCAYMCKRLAHHLQHIVRLPHFAPYQISHHSSLLHSMPFSSERCCIYVSSLSSPRGHNCSLAPAPYTLSPSSHLLHVGLQNKSITRSLQLSSACFDLAQPQMSTTS